MIFVANKKRSIDRIQKDYPNAKIFDITSSAPTPQGQKLSPFYPHYNIPIPGDSKGMTATCVEAIWQGLKVFEGSGIDVSMFRNDTMKNIKRTVRKFGKPLGHQYGVFSHTILNYADARRMIYVPSYKYVLDNVPIVHSLVEQLKERSKTEDIVLLDYNLNPDNRDITKPLSHAELVKMYIEGRYPEKEEDFRPYTKEELKELKKAATKRPSQKKKIETSEDVSELLNRITEILKNSERSAKDLSELLCIDGGSKTINKYIKRIPNLRVRAQKKVKYYTLMEIEVKPSLF